MDRQICRELSRNSIKHSLITKHANARALAFAGIAMLGVIWLATLAPSANAASVPNPTVIGPIPATAPPGDPSHGYPFLSTNVDLASHGYIEEEFFIEGTANRYNTPTLATGSVIDSGHPYRTRIIVRRPVRSQDFNGVVLMEWQNVAFGLDLDAGWAESHDHYIRRGYAWIGVSAQRVGVHQPVTGLKAWSPSRYGTLDVTQGGTILNDALSYDIFSQAAQAVRNPTGLDPMGGLHVQRVVAVGASQAADRLITYHNSIHPLAAVFDAFLVVIGGDVLRTDLNVKVFKILSETEIAGTFQNQAAIRQPDSDHFRRWEVAGSAHYDFHIKSEVDPLRIRDNVPQPSGQNCTFPPLSRIPFYFVLNAALDHLVRWVTDNTEPPKAPDIELVTLGPPVVISRDSFGNALGGIRLSQLAVPTATNTGVNGPATLPICGRYGTFQPFDEITLSMLYPNHGTYVSQVTQATHETLFNGFIVQEDAAATIRDAAHSDIGAH